MDFQTVQVGIAAVCMVAGICSLLYLPELVTEGDAKNAVSALVLSIGFFSVLMFCLGLFAGSLLGV